MTSEGDDRGARRRALVRSAFGKPGSLNRFIVGTAILVFACGLVALYVSWGARIVVFVFAVLMVFVASRARALAIGDEDEFRAAVLRERKRPAPVDPDPPESLLDPPSWVPPRNRGFEDAPPPPFLEVHAKEPHAEEGSATP